jgi:hypothetical protein
VIFNSADAGNLLSLAKQLAGRDLRCYFMRAGHIVSVEAIPDLSDEETVKRAWQLFAEKRKANPDYDGFEVWELARMVFQYPAPSTEKIL